jgi:pectate lyase
LLRWLTLTDPVRYFAEVMSFAEVTSSYERCGLGKFAQALAPAGAAKSRVQWHSHQRTKEEHMKYSTMSRRLVSSLLAVAALGLGCSNGDEITAGMPGGATPPAEDPSRTLADGWANVWTGDASRVTNGGADADAAHVYTVTNRTELVRALYPDAVIAADGTFSSANRADPTPKIIYVRGRISLSTNAAGEELTLEDYACPGYDFELFKTVYAPTEWNKLLDDGAPRAIPPCPGSQEELRQCSVRRQRASVEVRVGSNTSILGLGSDAKIVHGGLVIGGGSPGGAPPQLGPPTLTAAVATACGIEPPGAPAPAAAAPAPAPAAGLVPTAENVIVRNVTFEDAFDMFPAWTPDDSYSEPPAVANPEDLLYPLCQATYDPASEAGPQQCPGGRWNSEYDTLRVQNASHVWVDHCTFNDGDRDTQSSVWQAPYDSYTMRLQPHDGALDINGFADFVTVSNSVFRNHDKVMLIGGSDTVRDTNGWGFLSVTVHHNEFIDCGQRLPRVRFGKVHVYSNYVEGKLQPEIESPADWQKKPMPAHPMGSALAVGHLGKVYSEGNVYQLTGYPGDPAPTDQDVVTLAYRATPTTGTTPDVNQQTYFFDSGSLLNGAPTDLMAAAQERATSSNRPALLSTDSVWKPSDSYAYKPTAAADVKTALATSAGAGKLAVSVRK